MPETRIDLSPRRLTAALLLGAVGLLGFQLLMWFFVHGLGHDTVFGLVDYFDLSREGNLPTWYSALLLLIASGFLAMIAVHVRREGLPMGTRWTVLALVFLFLAIDEASAIHDLLYVNLARRFGTPEGIFHYTWVIPYGIATLAFAVAYLPFVAALPRATRRMFVLAGAVFVGSALGLEMTSAGVRGVDPWLTRVLMAVEETGEMVGIVLFIHGVTRHMQHLGTAFVVRVGD